MAYDLGLDTELNTATSTTDGSAASWADRMIRFLQRALRSTTNVFGDAAKASTGISAGNVPLVGTGGRLDSSLLPEASTTQKGLVQFAPNSILGSQSDNIIQPSHVTSANQATTTTPGFARRATAAEETNGTDVNAYVTPRVDVAASSYTVLTTNRQLFRTTVTVSSPVALTDVTYLQMFFSDSTRRFRSSSTLRIADIPSGFGAGVISQVVCSPLCIGLNNGGTNIQAYEEWYFDNNTSHTQLYALVSSALNSSAVNADAAARSVVVRGNGNIFTAGVISVHRLSNNRIRFNQSTNAHAAINLDAAILR